MKIAFLSDLQLGSGADYGTPRCPRLQDQAEALNVIRLELEERGVFTVVVAGDVFQHRRPAIDELVVFDRWLKSLDADVYLMAGNHDVRGPDVPATISVFGPEYQRGVSYHVTPTTFTRPANVTVDSEDGGESVALAFLPWAPAGPLRAARDGATPLEQAAAMIEIAQGLRARVVEEAPDAIPVLVTHFALSGFSTPSGVSTGELIGEPVLDSHSLAAQGWRFVFAGHIHKPGQIFGSQAATVTRLVSIGSPWVQDFGEADVEHGFWILDTKTEAADFVEVPGRRFVTLDWDLLSQGDVAEVPSVAQREIADAVVRVRVKTNEHGAAGFPLDEVRRNLLEAGAHKVFAIHLDVERQARARADVAEDSEPLAALDAWVASSGVEAPANGRLRELTSSLLTEVSS